MNKWFSLGSIRSSGDSFVLFVGVLTSAYAPVIIALGASILEWYRVFHGSLALGVSSGQAQLIAFFVVTANFVIPIYQLRQIAELGYIQLRSWTLRGAIGRFLNRIFDVEKVEKKDLYHNPSLTLAANVITITTILLAIYDLLNPILLQLVLGEYSEPIEILLVKFAIGLGLSFAGVYFLKSASHEIGVKMHQLASVEVQDSTNLSTPGNGENQHFLNSHDFVFSVENKLTEDGLEIPEGANPAHYAGFTQEQIDTWEVNREKALSDNGHLSNRM